MVVDYGDISAAINPMVEMYLDHYFLNDSLQLVNPTSEEIARWVYRYLSRDIDENELPIPNTSLHRLIFYRTQPGLRLAYVTIEETCTSRCCYYDTKSTVVTGYTGL